MPRTSDSQIEHRISKAALRLFDSGGVAAVTMGAVAREAHTTTPTVYKRFGDREKLLEAVTDEAVLQLLRAVRPARSVADYAERLLEFSLRHAGLFELRSAVFGVRVSTKQPTPIYDLLKVLITKEFGLHGAKCEQLAKALVLVIVGTLRTMIAAGIDTRTAKELQDAGLSTVQMLLFHAATWITLSDTPRSGSESHLRRTDLSLVVRDSGRGPSRDFASKLPSA